MSARVGELLVKTGVIEQDQFDTALETHKSEGGFIGTILVNKGFISEDDLVDLLSKQYGVPIIELEDYTVPDQVLDLVPHNLALKHCLVPLVQESTSLTSPPF